LRLILLFQFLNFVNWFPASRYFQMFLDHFMIGVLKLVLWVHAKIKGFDDLFSRPWLENGRNFFILGKMRKLHFWEVQGKFKDTWGTWIIWAVIWCLWERDLWREWDFWKWVLSWLPFAWEAFKYIKIITEGKWIKFETFDGKYESYNGQKHMNSITLVNRKSITINWAIDNHQKRNQTK
jgi:hypothetical protein